MVVGDTIIIGVASAEDVDIFEKVADVVEEAAGNGMVGELGRCRY